MEARVKVDKLALSAKGKGQIYYRYQDGIPNYNYDGFFNPEEEKVEEEPEEKELKPKPKLIAKKPAPKKDAGEDKA